ncbi:hypothetical protein E3P99_03064 [Wallemia hederae]|uniref:Zn(2)-C6 fungal-type domain-containing protein n=1 Tax=Wallemia hederae TaxID=1540922 RepID=A0A4T0FJR2_9BASI|nr:hypothetical protein E3P99_03064 [Wallemia hederae]
MSSSKLHPTARLKRACDFCRRSKIKCDAVIKYPSPCTACEGRTSGDACTFVDGAPKKKHSYAYVKGLEERIKELESKQRESNMSRQEPITTPSNSATAADADSDSELAQLVQAMWLDGGSQPGNLREFGMASNKSLFAMAAQFAGDGRQQAVGERAAEAQTQPYYSDADIGDLEVVLPLADLYFAHVHPTLPLFSDRSAFTTKLIISRHAQDFGSVVLLVCALGSLYFPSNASLNGDMLLFYKYLHTYLHKSPSALLEASLTVHFIQAHILAILAMQRTREYCRSCWSAIGAAALLAEDSGMAKSQDEDTKRAWWALYLLDKSFAVSYGRRVLLNAVDVDRPSAGALDGDIVAHFNTMSDLYAIAGNVVTHLYRNGGGKMSASDLDQSLDSWYHKYVYSTLATASQLHQMQVVGYHVVKIFVHKKNMKVDEPRYGGSNFAICISSAMQIISILHQLHVGSACTVHYTDALLNWSPITATGVIILGVCAGNGSNETQDLSLHLEYLEMGMRVLRTKSATDGVVRKAYELFEELIQNLSLRNSGDDALADGTLSPSTPALTGWHDYIMSSSTTIPQLALNHLDAHLCELITPHSRKYSARQARPVHSVRISQTAMSARYHSTQTSPSKISSLSALALVLSFSSLTHALFSSSIDTPYQCEELVINYHGDYTPPISYLIIPSNPEAPKTPDLIADYERDYSRTSTRIPQLNLPTGTEFTITLSDANGFGTGGTSRSNRVKSGISDGCLYEADSSWMFYMDPRNASTCEWIEFAVSEKNNTDPYSYYAISPDTMPREIAKNLTSNDEHVAYQVTEPMGTQIGFVGVLETKSQYNHGGSSSMQVVKRGNDTSCSKPPEASPSPSKKKSGLSTSEYGGIIFGIIAGAVLVLLGLIGGLWYKRRYKRRLLNSRAQEVDLVDKAEGQDVDDLGTFEPTPYMRQTVPANKTGATHAHSASELLPLNATENNVTPPPYAQKRTLSHVSTATDTGNTMSSTHPPQSTLNSRNAIYHSDAGSFHEDEGRDGEEEEQHIPPPLHRHAAVGTIWTRNEVCKVHSVFILPTAKASSIQVYLMRTISQYIASLIFASSSLTTATVFSFTRRNEQIQCRNVNNDYLDNHAPLLYYLLTPSHLLADSERNSGATSSSIPQPPSIVRLSQSSQTLHSHSRRYAAVGMSVSSYSGLMAGIVIGVLVFLAAIIGSFVYIRRYRRRMQVLNAKEVDLDNKAPDEDVDDMASVHAFLSQRQEEEEGISSYKKRDEFNQEHTLHAATHTETRPPYPRKSIQSSTDNMHITHAAYSTSIPHTAQSAQDSHTVYHSDAGSFHEEEEEEHHRHEERHVPPPYVERLDSHAVD